MQGNWRDLFSFNRRERNGIFVLATLIVLVICIQVAMPFFVSSKVETDTTILDRYVAQLKLDSAEWVRNNKIKYQNKYDKERSSKVYGDSINRYAKNSNANKTPSKRKVEETFNPHVFNPNLASDEDWKSVGLNKGQIKSINNYLDKGGEFRRVLDVKKMYVISDVQYSKMEEYLEIPEITSTKSNYEPKEIKVDVEYEKKAVSYLIDSFSIEINTADTVELKRLKGVGSYYAKQIVYYRDKLGGYYSLAQLYEIEHMRESTVLKILPFLKVDTMLIKKIHVNSAIAPDMVKHPYITWNMAIQIQDYRDFSHKFKSIEDLVKNGLLNDEIYSKLAPYIEL